MAKSQEQVDSHSLKKITPLRADFQIWAGGESNITCSVQVSYFLTIGIARKYRRTFSSLPRNQSSLVAPASQNVFARLIILWAGGESNSQAHTSASS